MAMGLCIQHWGHGPIIVCSYDEPGLTLTYFIANSKLAPCSFCMGKPENNGFLGTILDCYETCISGSQ